MKVSVLFNEPKLLKFCFCYDLIRVRISFSALQRAEIAEIKRPTHPRPQTITTVSVLFNEPKLLKSGAPDYYRAVHCPVSVLFNEPKLLKSTDMVVVEQLITRFSALQRAEIAEITTERAEPARRSPVSVLFNEPKLLKYE